MSFSSLLTASISTLLFDKSYWRYLCVFFQELTTNCTWRWEEKNGVKGNLVTGPNGNSIFLPATGYRSGTETFNYNTGGYYWSVESDYVDDGDTEFLKQSAVGLYFIKDYSSWDFYSRHLGFQIRPVKDK